MYNKNTINLVTDTKTMKKTAFFTALFAFTIIITSAPAAEAAYTRPADSRATTCRTSSYGLGFGYSTSGKTLCEPETCTPGNSDYGLGFGYSISGKKFCGQPTTPTYSSNQTNSVTTYRLTSNTSFYGSNDKSSYDTHGAYSSYEDDSEYQYSDEDYGDESYEESDNDDHDDEDSQYDDRDNNDSDNDNDNDNDDNDSGNGSGNGGGPFSW